MTAPTLDALYGLIPAVYRARDAEVGYPLRALVETILAQHLSLRAGIEAAWDGWFIETCAPWQIPYLAELVGIDPERFVRGVLPTDRAYVANAIRDRRRKGTTRGLQEAFTDATGLPALAVDGRHLCGVTLSLRAPEPDQGRLVDVRRDRDLRAGTPFDRLTRTALLRDVPLITSTAGGGSAIARPGAATVYAWRLLSYPVLGATAFPVGPGRYTVDPTGVDVPLFTPPGPRRLPPPNAGPDAVPGPLDPWWLAEELADRRAGRAARTGFFGSAPAVRVHADGVPLDPARLGIADLGDWARPRPFLVPPDAPEPTCWLDPTRGRLWFPVPPSDVAVDSAVGFPGDVGAGPYPDDWPVPAPSVVHVHDAGQLLDALAAWQAAPGDEDGAIELVTSVTHAVGEVVVDLRGRTLTLHAGPWQRPCVRGTLTFVDSTGSGSVVLAGLLVDGGVVAADDLSLDVRHCTLVPGRGPGGWSIAVVGGAGEGAVALTRTVSGPIRADEGVDRLAVHTSVVDGGGGVALSGRTRGSTPVVHLRRSTFLGGVDLEALERAEDCVVTGPLRVARTGVGSVGHCWLGPGSVTPTRHRTWPHPTDPPPAALFDAVAWGRPDYARVALHAPRPLRDGGSDQRALGAFPDAFLPADAHRIVFDDVRRGFTAAIVFAT